MCVAKEGGGAFQRNHEEDNGQTNAHTSRMCKNDVVRGPTDLGPDPPIPLSNIKTPKPTTAAPARSACFPYPLPVHEWGTYVSDDYVRDAQELRQ